MMNQSADGYNPSQYVKYSGPRRGGGAPMTAMPVRPPPPTYRCYRCGQQGHYINQCPTNGVCVCAYVHMCVCVGTLLSK